MERKIALASRIDVLLRQYNIPKSFLSLPSGNGCCIFVISCHILDSCPQIGTAPEDLTGYTTDEFQKGGMKFWFSLIHPEDLPVVSRKIIDAHEALNTMFPNGRAAIPLLFQYRLKHLNGKYLRVKDSRYLLSHSGEGVIDDILCRIECNEQKYFEELVLENLLRKGKSYTKMLEAAILQQVAQKKEILEGSMTFSGQDHLAVAPKLTAREKEILRLVADGLSSKMIADKCCISINTVETHRRHLLEKLGVRNSMELIKEASKVFVL